MTPSEELMKHLPGPEAAAGVVALSRPGKRERARCRRQMEAPPAALLPDPQRTSCRTLGHHATAAGRVDTLRGSEMRSAAAAREVRG